ncbi:MAG: hypothetical protein IKB68_04870 [Rikenellaceae bacterium]|nr:hypothetical protein [Rikenellaceae bacterium]
MLNSKFKIQNLGFKINQPAAAFPPSRLSQTQPAGSAFGLASVQDSRVKISRVLLVGAAFFVWGGLQFGKIFSIFVKSR